MADAAIEDEVVVTVDNQQAVTTDGQTIQKQETIDPVDDLKKQHDTLKADRDRLQAERDAALRRAQAAQQEVTTARSEITEREAESIDAGISAAQAEAEAAAKDQVAALEAGDFAKAAEAARKAARAEARIERYNEAKADIEARKTAPVEKRSEQRQEQQVDPVEAYIQGRTEPTANWLRAHREWVSDPTKNAYLTEAHYNAVRSGRVVDTPEYFAHVEEYIGLKPKAEAKTNGATPPARRTAPPVAPVSGAGGGTNGGGAEVRLSKAEVASATDGTLVWNYNDPSGQNRFKKGDPIGVQEMARRKLELQRSGQYDKSYTEQ